MKKNKYRRKNYKSYRNINSKLNALQKKRMIEYQGRRIATCD